jgi:putative phosphoesterase
VRVLVLADTHVRLGGTRRLPDVVYEELDRADAILHAGDVTAPELLDELEGFAPVHAVLGNNDVGLAHRLPESQVVALGGVEVAMVHDSGPRSGREGRMARRFPSAQVVVFGHSHIPEDHVGMGGQRLFNPGSPTDRRGQPCHTYGLLELEGGAVLDHRIVPVEA